MKLSSELKLVEGYRALAVKEWIIQELTAYGWITLLVRSMPKLLSYNPYFSAYFISESAIWTNREIDILNNYMVKLFGRKISEELLHNNSYEFYKQDDQAENMEDIVRESRNNRKEIFELFKD